MTSRGSFWRYLLASVVTAGFVFLSAENSPPLWETVLQAVTGLAALVAMRWRHRYPMALSLTLIALSPLLPSVSICASWAYISLCTQRAWWKTLAGGVAMFAFTMTDFFLREGMGEILQGGVWVFMTVFVAVVVVLLAAWGSYIGARREAKQAVADRVNALEREREVRVEAARAEERARLAREMHDVLAHKISLIAMHAGALAYREDLDPAETRAVAGTIQGSAHQALTELRTILGQLRQVDGGQPSPPQPTLANLDALLAEHRAVGRRVEAEVSLEGEPRDAVGRHAYRIVQECLTNAARHAPNTRVRVMISGALKDGLSIRVTNPLPVKEVNSPGAGLGLVGLDERVQLLGGTMTAGPEGHEFVVEVRLPW